MASLTSDQEEAIREFIEYGKSEFGFPTHKSLSIALVLTGEREGCLIGFSEDEYAEKIKEIFGEYIPYQYNKSRSIHQFYIGKASRHIKRYNPASAGDRKVGQFFGYPNSAIDFYIENSDRVDQYNEFLQSPESPLTLEEESDKLFLIEYIPTPTEDGIQEALDRQRRYEKTLNSLSVKLSDANNFGIR